VARAAVWAPWACRGAWAATWAARATWATAVVEAAEALVNTTEQEFANIVREIIPIEMFNIDPNSTYINQ